jgi:uncharacterized protein YkwD
VNRRLAVLAALVSLAGTACTHQAAQPGAVAPVGDALVLPEHFDGGLLTTDIVAGTNRARLAHGAAALVQNQALDSAADEQASSMALAGEAGHANPFPGEHNVAERVSTQGVEGGHVGENVIMIPLLRAPDGTLLPCTYAELAARLVDAWMNSPGHRANMLNPHFTHIGCAARLAHGAIAANMRVYACQVFYLARPGQGDIPGLWLP